jgi:hypothetical protein
MKRIFLACLGITAALTSQAQLSVTTGGQKYVVVEDVTGAWCQFCPDGTVVQEQVLAATPRAIGVAMHNADKMSFADANAVMASPNLVCGYPGGLINRKNFNCSYCSSGCTTALTAVGRNNWQTVVDNELALPTGAPKWDITMTHSFVPSTRTLTVNVTAKALGAQTGNYNINVWVMEDSVVGPNVTGYNQVNAYNVPPYGTASHPFWGKGNPVVGFVHRHVERAYLGGTWGTTGIIPNNAPANGTYTKSYTHVIPAAYDAVTPGAPQTNLNRMYLVAMVMRETTSKMDREIMNAVQAKMVPWAVGINDVQNIQDLTIFPNPAQNEITVKGILNQPGNVRVAISNSLGQIVSLNNYKYAGNSFGEVINVENLTNGVYFVNISTDKGEKATEKLTISK